jgi:tetratricopeptide (TPR) repeat protein
MNIASTEYNSNYFLGYACYYLAEYKPAIEYLSNQLILEPNTQDALFYRAKAYMKVEQAEQAEQDLTQLINLKDDYILAHYYRAIIRKDCENYVEALADIHKSVQQNPDDTNFLSLRGEIQEALGDSLAAKADYDRAIDLKGTNRYEVLFKRGLLNYLVLGDQDAAVADLTAVIEGSAKPNTLASFMRGLLFTDTDKLEEANADFESVLKLDSTYTEVYFYWAVVKFKMEKYDEALRLITLYLKDADTLSEPDLANAYQLIGKTQLQKKDFAAALQAFDQSLAYDDQIGETHFWFAKTLIALKRKDEACTSLYKALDLGYEDAELELEEECGYSIPLEEDQE